MNIKPIRNPADHAAALKEIEALMNAGANTPEGDKLDVLVTLVEAWEQKHFPMDFPSPVEAIKFRMEQTGLSVKDLEPILGKSNRVYEILNQTRKLTLPMIRRLHRDLGIPVECLIQEYPA
jgi:HTH-type transcriptional regulator/antitoxin HigA